MAGVQSTPQELRRMYSEVEREIQGVCEAVLQHICGLGAEHAVPPLSPLEVEDHRRELEDARECIRRYIVPADPQEYLRKYTQSPYMRRDVEIKIKNPLCDSCRIRQEKALAKVQAQHQRMISALEEEKKQIQPQLQQQQLLLQQEELLRSQQSSASKKKGKNAKKNKKKQQPQQPPAPSVSATAASELSRQSIDARIHKAREDYKVNIERERDKNPLRKALWYCPECTHFLCGGCDVECHAEGSGIELHNRQTLGQFIEAYDSKTYGIGYCKEHPRQPVQVFCRTCNAMICLICTLELHARHDLFSVADDSFDLDQLTPAELTRENLYATLLPMVRCSTSPAKAYAAEQRERYAKRCCTGIDDLSLPRLMTSAQVLAGGGGSGVAGVGVPSPVASDSIHTEKVAEVVSSSSLPEPLEGVKVECALNFAPYAPVRSQYPLSSLSSLCAGMGRVGDNALAQALRSQRRGCFPPDIDSDLSRQVSAMESYLSDLASSEVMASLSRPLQPPLSQQQQQQQQQQRQQRPTARQPPAKSSRGASSSSGSSSSESSSNCSSSCSGSSSASSSCSGDCSSSSS